ncbi:YheC/YheD family protein [Marininema halotolerans]|uniref:YheC/D like ATP-grasp n=1 Tax=Marininema halotolerans TaxID=1155944 RepID=A0A1I6NSY2_9BACL|nr:YheC/YheD family protein [Marininema halotolerans]SFS30948.1 YheC/D like ATP-grasp [Marininema halotolerans]
MKVSYKWVIHRNLMKVDSVKNSVPTTMLYSQGAFVEMLRKYGSLVLKPSGGTGGHGVILIRSLPGGRYNVQINQKIRDFPNELSLVNWVNKQPSTVKTRYLIQQCIPLAQINGSPFTIRTVTQRRPQSNWVLTGWVAKAAGKGYFITNGRSGGTVFPVDQAITRSNAHANVDQVLQELRRVSLKAAQHLGNSSPRQRVVGFDMGIDRDGKVWIIEANPKPRFKAFLKLKDQSMYRRIMGFQRSPS